MIKLAKTKEPTILAQNAKAWTEAVVDKIAKGEKPSKTEKGRYNHHDIKTALIHETHGKCAYCESKLRHVTYGDIEHVVPKSREPQKMFSWDNLTLACDVCNTNKSDAPIDHNNFVDPYSVDPEDEFWHLGAMLYPRPGRDSAALTEKLLELNRAALLERRTERMNTLLKFLDVIERCSSGVLRNILWDDFCKEGLDRNEYAALSRTIIAMAKGKLGY